MKKNNVKITKEALKDVNDLYEYIAVILQVPEIALEQYDRIADAILELDIFPERFRPVDFEPEHSKRLR